MEVLFICLGNICRSPMAEALLRRMRSDLSVSSAGISALVGSGASSKAVEVMLEQGVDIRDHRARQVDREMLEGADLVLTMEGYQRDRLQELDPEYDNVYTLGDYTRHGGDIPDPYGSSREAFLRVARDIAAALEAGFGN